MGGGDDGDSIFVLEKKLDFKANCFKKNQMIPEAYNSKRKLQNMVKRKLTRTKLEIYFYQSILNLAQEHYIVLPHMRTVTTVRNFTSFLVLNK